MEKVVNWNSYWAHHENVLVAMFYDDSEEVRQRAFNIVVDLQTRASGTTKVRKQVKLKHNRLRMDVKVFTIVRKFKKPKVVWSHEHYSGLLHLVNATRCMERAVQTNTLATAITQTDQHREDFLANLEFLRERMSDFVKKGDWVNHTD